MLREDQVRLYRYRPLDEAPDAGKRRIPVLIAYALIGRFEMIDLQEDRSLVRKLLRHGLDVYAVDWGYPGRAERWLTIDDYVNGYLDACVDAVRERSGATR
jgi:polyhydroxyalkanoate synthase